jgi:hypothetical protein
MAKMDEHEAFSEPSAQHAHLQLLLRGHHFCCARDYPATGGRPSLPFPSSLSSPNPTMSSALISGCSFWLLILEVLMQLQRQR